MSKSQAEQAADQLKDLLIGCVLEPGAFYTEAVISSLIGLGKTPVREALTRSIEQGWVKPAKGRGYEILPVTFGGVRELFAARLIVEPAATELAAGRVDDETVDFLLGLCRPAPYERNLTGCLEYLRTNRQIHETVVAASGNSVLTAIVGRLLERSDRLMFMGMAANNWESTASADRVQLVRAVADGEGRRARTLAAAQIREIERASMNALLKTPAIEDVEVRLFTSADASV